ncbi:hypothetical protein Tdes44962_MAKER07931 [Teratosphaeria destructans]|uniref:Uncharacterized protein n=1 Tax=Teratosphaeria destructans TaxID=418781 RepID=A0A9W7SYB6_9PEZI|nr:hypothetical protein Tdes44962_MAKER07931 [Teratosphaeria destructans]
MSVNHTDINVRHLAPHVFLMSSPSVEGDATKVRKHIVSIPRPPTPPSSDCDPDPSTNRPPSPIAARSPIAQARSSAPSATNAIASLDATDELLLRQIQSGEKTSLSIRPSHFTRLAPHLREFRVDYDPKQEKLLRRMPGSVHEEVLETLRRRLYLEQERVQKSEHVDPRVRHPIASVVLRGSTSITLGQGVTKEIRSPDISITDEHDDTLPTFICEVAHSQTAEKVKELCPRYIERSEGVIQCTLAVDLPYGRPGPGSVTVYRIGEKKIDGEIWGCAVEEQTATICDPDGDAEDAAIELRASDFLRLDPEDGGDEADRTRISIPLAEISRAYRKAMEGQEEASQRPREATKRKRHDARQKRWPQPKVTSGSEYEDEEAPQAKRQQRRGAVEDTDPARPMMSLRSRSTRPPAASSSTPTRRKSEKWKKDPSGDS